MNLLRQPIERKLSSLLGAQVNIDKLSFSLLKGAIEAEGVTLAGDSPDLPLLTIRRIRAEVSVGKALQKQIVVKSLRVESPQVNIHRRRSGATNLPLLKTAEDSSGASEPREESDDSDWKFDVERVQLFDGSIHFFKDQPGKNDYHVSVEKVAGELERQADRLTLTLLGKSAGRRDEPVELGEIRLRASFSGVDGVTRWLDAGMEASLEVANLAKLDVRCPLLRDRQFQLSAFAASDLDFLLRLVP